MLDCLTGLRYNRGSIPHTIVLNEAGYLDAFMIARLELFLFYGYSAFVLIHTKWLIKHSLIKFNWRHNLDQPT